MRILIASDTADVRNGGACIQLWNLRRLLETAGHDVEVFSFDPSASGKPGWHAEPEPNGTLARKLHKLTFFPRGYAALRRQVARFRPDVVHINSNFKYPASMLWAVRDQKVMASARDYVWVCPTGWAVRKSDLEPCPGGAGLKCVAHGCKSAPEMALFQGPLSFVRDRLARKIVRRFLSPSARLAETMRMHGYYSDVLRNPVAGGVPADAPSSGATPADVARSRAPRRPAFLFVGAMEEKKGVYILFDAFRRLAARRPDVSLEFAGRGAAIEVLQRQAADAGLSERVTFHGHVAREQVRTLYGEVTALVTPSLWMENFPNVVYEAMSHDCPVIGSDRGGIAELLADERGWLYPAKDADALAERMEAVLAGPTGDRTQAARSYVEIELAESKFLGEYLRHASEVSGVPVNPPRPATEEKSTGDDEGAAESRDPAGRAGRAGSPPSPESNQLEYASPEEPSR